VLWLHVGEDEIRGVDPKARHRLMIASEVLPSTYGNPGAARTFRRSSVRLFGRILGWHCVDSGAVIRAEPTGWLATAAL
jgi:hypothetical protein